jgi:hypothetical protein
MRLQLSLLSPLLLPLALGIGAGVLAQSAFVAALVAGVAMTAVAWWRHFRWGMPTG